MAKTNLIASCEGMYGAKATVYRYGFMFDTAALSRLISINIYIFKWYNECVRSNQKGILIGLTSIR